MLICFILLQFISSCSSEKIHEILAFLDLDWQKKNIVNIRIRHQTPEVQNNEVLIPKSFISIIFFTYYYIIINRTCHKKLSWQ